MSFARTLTFAAAAAVIAGAAFAQPAAPPAAPASGANNPTQQPAQAAPSAAAQGFKPIQPAGDMAATLAASGQFAKFLAAAEKAGLTPLLKGTRQLTVFVPTDAALGTSLDALNAQELQPILVYHVYGATIAPDQIAGKKGPVQTAANKPIEVDGSVMPMKVNDSVVLQGDVHASNGIIYVLDKPLTPPA